VRIVLYTDAVEIGGAEMSLRHLAAHLSPELEVTVLGIDDAVVDLVAAGRSSARKQLVPGRSRSLDLRSLAAHARALRALRPDVLHCNLWSPWSCQYAVVGALATPSAPVVCVYQLLVPAANRQQHMLKRVTSRRVAVHVGVGDRTAGDLEALIPLRAGSVRTIHNGIPVEAPRIDRARTGEVSTIGVSGRLEPQKGIDVLLHALVRLPQAALRVVGEGSFRAELEQLASRLGVADRVTWVGWSADPRRELESVDVFVQPSRFEAFPLAILEAMLAGLPVVATDVGSVADAIIDGETGTLVRPEDPVALADAVAALLEDPQARAAIGDRARARVLEHFSAKRMAGEFESLYQELAR
jgi:glycosyltransferase involved in cell wall biosynthesis